MDLPGASITSAPKAAEQAVPATAVAGPFVRSSYRAERVLEGNNLGLDPVNPEVLEGIRDSAGASLRC